MTAIVKLVVVAAVVAALPPLPKLAPLPPLASDGLKVQAWTAVDKQPGNPAVGFGSVWVPSSATGLLDRVDPKTLKVVARIRSAKATTAGQNEYFDSVAASPHAVWHASDLGNVVVKVDPRRNRVLARIPVSGRPDAIAAGASGVYVSLFQQTTVLRIDPARNKIVVRRDLHVPGLGIAYGAHAVWVVTSTGPSILQLDPSTLKVRRRISIVAPQPFVGGYFSAWWIAADDSTVCAGNQLQNVVTAVDAATGKIATQALLPAGTLPFSVAADGSACWATNTAGVSRVAADGSATISSHLPGLGPSKFTGVAVGAGKGWVTLAGRNALLAVAPG